MTERRLDLNGVSTSVLEGGSGAPIVLLHGPGAYGAQWIHAIPSLAATHRVIAPDLPGHGASASFDGAPTHERVVAWLDDLIECTCSKAPVLVGHTLGGAIAMRFAAAMTRPLAALVLVDTLGLAAFQPAPAFGAALQAFLQAPTGTTHDALWSQCVFDLEDVRRRMGERWQWIKAYNLSGVQAAGTSGLIAWMEQFGAPDAAPGARTHPDADHAHLGPPRSRDTPVGGRNRASELRMEARDHRWRRGRPDARAAASVSRRVAPGHFRSRMMKTNGILFGLIAAAILSTANAHDSRVDAVLEWNRIAFDGVLRQQPPPEQMRIGAILELAVFEAVNAVGGEYESTLGTVNAHRRCFRRGRRGERRAPRPEHLFPRPCRRI